MHRDPRAILFCHRLGKYGLKAIAAIVLLIMAIPIAAMAGQSDDRSYTSNGDYSATASGYSDDWMQSRLMRFYQHWQGVRYRYGGEDRRGVDCSGLVYRFYRDRFGMDVPRSTQLLAGMSHRLRPNKLAPGDILIFRIEGKGRHVGIYVADGTFIHASKSKGVMKSSLANSYWASRYHKAARIIEPEQAAGFSRRRASL